MKAKIISVLLCALLAGGVIADDTRVAPAAGAKAQQPSTRAARDADAMYRRALSYETGSGDVKANRAKMLKWLTMASNQGSGIASYKLYTYYAAEPNGYKQEIRYWDLAQRQGYCGPPVISNVRGPKVNEGYQIKPCAAGAPN